VKPGEIFTRHRTVELGAISAHVAEAGEGVPIVLLHGNPDSHAVWSGVVEQLAGSHHCIAPDLPGFGDTRAPDFDCAIEHQGAFVGDLLDALALDRVHLVVHDIGAVFGLTFATHHPERLRSITIFNNSFFPHHFWARVWQTRGLGELAMAVANRPLFVGQMRRGSPRMPREYAEHAYAVFGRSTRKMALRWYRVMRREIPGWDARFVEATARMPKQVIWGDLDPFIPRAMADRYGAPVRHVEDCGHWVMVEEPALAAAAIAELLR
jgi:pimeloyl-ACP methyl ester carboxylesterase